MPETFEQLEKRLTRKSKRALADLKKNDGGLKTQKRMYSAARGSRLRGDWISSDTSADTELLSSLRQLRSRSRALCRDVSYARRAKVLVINNVIGAGVGMQAQVFTTRGELNKRVNDEIEAVWHEWGQADSCHTGGRFAFSDFERALMGQVFEAGEVFVRKHYVPFGSSRVPYALELVEAERLADDLVLPNTTIDYRMGIEVDSFYRPVAYYFRRRHPGELRFSMASPPETLERVPADQVIHLVYGERWPQTRGEPWMAATINTFRDMSGYIEAEITRARIQASPPWTIETPEDATSFGEEQDDGSVEMTVEPGIAKRLNPGEKLNASPVNSPNSQVEPFMRYLLRDVAAGVGPSYESLSRDYSQSNYSSSRLALLDDRDLWRVFQSWFIATFRMPVHREWLQQAVLAQAFKSFTVEQWALDRAKFEAVRFRPRGWGWVDPTKEVEAFRDAVRSGFMTQQDVVATSGADIEEIIEQRKKEVELATEAGLVFDTDPSVELEEPADDPPDDDDEENTPANEPGSGRVLRLTR